MQRAIFIVLVLGVPCLAQGWSQPPADTGNLYISGFSTGNVGEYLPDGTLVRTLSHPTMLNPRGVGVEDDGTLVVVVQTSSRILRMSPDGTLLQTITHPDLTSGTGLSRSPSGHWYVGSFSPGRVVVFDASWNWVSTLTATVMNGVNCVSFDSSGNGDFAVTAALVNQVFRFDAAHNPIGVVTHPNIGSPMSLADDSSGNHYLSNGSSGWIIKFDPSWTPLFSFGAGTLSATQGIAVDENDVLTISNFSASTVHRYDTSGSLLSSFALTGVTTGRNLTWQTSPRILSREGAVGLGASVVPEAVLSVSGQTGDALRRVSLALTDPFDLAVAAPSQGPSTAQYVIYARAGEPGLADVATIPFGLGDMCFHPPFLGGMPVVVANTAGLEPILGTGVVGAFPAPTTVFSFPTGFGTSFTLTFQGLINDAGSAAGPAVPWSVTNAVIAVIN